MNDITVVSSQLIPLPEPRVAISIRPGVLADVPFMDQLQKQHAKAVGWMPTQQLEGKIALGHVLVAEEVTSNETRATSENLVTRYSSPVTPVPVGYLIGNDRYFKRDDVGIVYQVNVVPGHQRGLIGAALLKAQFERSAYGCRLYCCWCAQDLAANRFWEAMGFVPLAFRTGSRTRGSRTKGAKSSPRVHIFWQKRIREGDVDTPWWFPCQTGSGAIREDRIVLPIPPGVRWEDAMPVVLPAAGVPGNKDEGGRMKDEKGAELLPAPKKTARAARQAVPAKSLGGPGGLGGLSGLQFATPKAPRPKREKVAMKNDPKVVAAARELRDRWLEELVTTPLLPAGKYEVSRRLPPPQAFNAAEAARLEAA